MLECLGHCHSKLVHGSALQISGVTCFKFQFLVPALSFLIENPQGTGVRARLRNLPFNQHFRWLYSWNLSYFRSRFHISVIRSNAEQVNTSGRIAFLFGNRKKVMIHTVLIFIRMAVYYVYAHTVLVGMK